MGKDIFSKIGYPYDKMLHSLENVEGYKQFVKFIENRIDINNDWKGEIKALFEINKKCHPLVGICSHKPSEPEGIFKVNNELGIIEVAFVRYLFDENEAKRKLINRVKNYLQTLDKYLTGEYKDYVISVIIFSLDIKPTDSELKSLREHCFDFFRKGGKNLVIFKRFGIIMLNPENRPPSLNMTNREVSFIIKITRTGVATGSYNVDLNKKIQQLLKDKRKQHESKYKDTLKVYYLFINCPPNRLREIEKKKVSVNIKSKEVVVICAVYVDIGGLFENKMIISGHNVNNHSFDFSNEYYSR